MIRRLTLVVDFALSESTETLLIASSLAATSQLCIVDMATAAALARSGMHDAFVWLQPKRGQESAPAFMELEEIATTGAVRLYSASSAGRRPAADLHEPADTGAAVFGMADDKRAKPDIVRDVSIFLIDGAWSHALEADPAGRGRPKPFFPSKPDRAFAEEVRAEAGQRHGILRIDAQRTCEGSLSLRDAADAPPSLSLGDLPPDDRERALQTLVRSISAFLDRGSMQDEPLPGHRRDAAAASRDTRIARHRGDHGLDDDDHASGIEASAPPSDSNGRGDHNSELWMPPTAFATPAPLDGFAERGFAFARPGDGTAACVAAAFEAGRAFFALPPYEKLADRLPLDAGYRPQGVEYSAEGGLPDEVESFTLSGRGEARDLAGLSASGRALHDSMSEVFVALLPTVADAVRTLAVTHGGGDLPALTASLRRWSILQMNFARPSGDPARCINEEHEDGCLLTAMLSTAPGLEMRVGDGAFEAVAAGPTGLVLAAGEILWLLSGGAIARGFHRVRPVEGVAGRMSLLLFADVGPELCAPWRLTDVNRGTDIGRRVLTNATRYGLAQWEPG